MSTPALPENFHSPRDPAPMLQAILRDWHQIHSEGGDLWIFAYASLIWRPDFDYAERRIATVHGWRRGLEMWSHINRGTPECPGLVFALLRGSPQDRCPGVAFRIPSITAGEVLTALWQREMPSGVYDPLWLPCDTAQGHIKALAFTLSHSSPSFCGELSPARYRQIFRDAQGRYGTTLEYAQRTYEGLQREGIEDEALAKLLAHR